MFTELNEPKFVTKVSTGEKLWQISTTFQINNYTRYMTIGGGIISSPIRYDRLEDVWSAAAKHYADNGRVYPYAYVVDEDEESVIQMSDTIIEIIRLKVEKMKDEENESTAMRFE